MRIYYKKKKLFSIYECAIIFNFLIFKSSRKFPNFLVVQSVHAREFNEPFIINSI